MTGSSALSQLDGMHASPRWSFDGFGINDRQADYCPRIATAATHGTHGRLELIAHQANHADPLAVALGWVTRCLERPGPHMDPQAAIESAKAILRAYRGELAQ